MLLKQLLVIGLAISAAEAYASPSNVVIINHSNKIVACATITFDTASQSTATHSWYIVNNGSSLNVGPTFFVYCEQKGNPSVHWTDNSGEQFCANTPAEYVDPIFFSNNSIDCRGVGGVMRPFKHVDGSTRPYNWTLNP